MSQDSSTRPPPGPERVDLARLELKRLRLPPRGEHEARPFSEEDERAARMIAAVEGRLLGAVGDIREQIEERLESRQSAVHVQVTAPEEKKQHPIVRFLTLLAAVLAGAGTLTASIAALYAQMHKEPDPDLLKRLSRLEAFQKRTEQQLVNQSAYDHQFRNDTQDLFEQLGIKIVRAPGEMPHDPIPLEPAPLIDPHKVSKVPRVQPARPLALPPVYDSESSP